MVSDRAVLVKAFDESRTGVCGLVESGISSVTELFIHPDPYASLHWLCPVSPSQSLTSPFPPRSPPPLRPRPPARHWGFFHLVNHHQVLAITDDYPARAVAAVRAFNELLAPERSVHYGRDTANGGVKYYSNIDLYRSPAASWRDSIRVGLEVDRRDPIRMPHACLDDIPSIAHATAVAHAMLGLLSFH